MTLIVPVLQNKRSGSNQNLHRKSGIENRAVAKSAWWYCRTDHTFFYVEYLALWHWRRSWF